MVTIIREQQPVEKSNAYARYQMNVRVVPCVACGLGVYTRGDGVDKKEIFYAS